MSNEHVQNAAAVAHNVGQNVDGPPYVQLFQKAHQHIVMLDRIEEQLTTLLARQQELQDELRGLQSHINDELEDRINGVGEPPTRILANVANAASHTNAASNAAAANPPTASRASANRFASQSLTGMAEE